MKEQFKAAARFINGRRDTLFYASLAVATAAYYVATNDVTRLPLIIGGSREMVRSFSWAFFTTQTSAAETPRGMPHNMRFAFSAMAGSVNLWALEHGFKQDFDSALFFTGMMAIGVVYAGGPRKVLSAYQAMWDFPNKRVGPNNGNDGAKREPDHLSISPRKRDGRVVLSSRTQKAARDVQNKITLDL